MNRIENPKFYLALLFALLAVSSLAGCEQKIELPNGDFQSLQTFFNVLAQSISDRFEQALAEAQNVVGEVVQSEERTIEDYEQMLIDAGMLQATDLMVITEQDENNPEAIRLWLTNGEGQKIGDIGTCKLFFFLEGEQYSSEGLQQLLESRGSHENVCSTGYDGGDDLHSIQIKPGEWVNATLEMFEGKKVVAVFLAVRPPSREEGRLDGWAGGYFQDVTPIFLGNE